MLDGSATTVSVKGYLPPVLLRVIHLTSCSVLALSWAGVRSLERKYLPRPLRCKEWSGSQPWSGSFPSPSLPDHRTGRTVQMFACLLSREQQFGIYVSKENAGGHGSCMVPGERKGKDGVTTGTSPRWWGELGGHRHRLSSAGASFSGAP